MKQPKRSKNILEEKPSLLKLFASSSPSMVFLKLTPILIILCYLIMNKAVFSIRAILWLLLGLLFWSFFEYVVHRWIYHQKFKKKVQFYTESLHIHHHKNLTDYRVLNAGFLLIYISFILIFGLAYLIGKGWTFPTYFSLGVLCYYFFYEVVHYYIHYKQYQSGYMAWIQKYHLYHHYKRWNRNFGNTLSFWDKLLGTYDSGYKSFQISQSQFNDFIKNRH